MTAVIDSAARMYTSDMSTEPEVPEELPIFKARNQMAEIIEKSRYFGGVTFLTNRGRRAAAVVPVEVAERYLAEQRRASSETAD